MKINLKSKLGRPFWRFGVQLSPDKWTEFDLTEAQLESIKDQCTRPVAEGGTLDIEFLEEEAEPSRASRSTEETAPTASQPPAPTPRESSKPPVMVAKESPKGEHPKAR